MTNKFKAALNEVHAEDKLKADTISYLQGEINKRGRAKRLAPRMLASAACLAVILVSAFFAHNAYFTAAAYVDVDVNPSVELVVNRFDRVIGVYVYDGGGEALLNGLTVKHKMYGVALYVIVDTLAESGYVDGEPLVSVTVQTDDKQKEQVWLSAIRTELEAYMDEHGRAVLLDIFPVSGATRTDSHELDISPAKYLAIQELIAIDPTASVESCKGHTISEIKLLAKNHGNHHGGADAGTAEQGDADTVPPEHEVKQEENETAPAEKPGHGGNGHGHGNGHG